MRIYRVIHVYVSAYFNIYWHMLVHQFILLNRSLYLCMSWHKPTHLSKCHEIVETLGSQQVETYKTGHLKRLLHTPTQRHSDDTHSKKKSTSGHLFWCSRLSQIEDCIQYLEGPNSTWKDHDRNLGVHLDPKIPVMVLPGTIWSFQVLNRVLYL